MSSENNTNEYVEAKNTVIQTQPGGDDNIDVDDVAAAGACACCAVLCAPCICCCLPCIALCSCLSCCLPDDHPDKPKPKPRK